VPAGKKKGQKSAASKKKSTKSKGGGGQRKNNSKTGQPYAGNDLTAKLFATMEKHKDVCFITRLPCVLNIVGVKFIQYWKHCENTCSKWANNVGKSAAKSR